VTGSRGLDRCAVLRPPIHQRREADAATAVARENAAQIDQVSHLAITVIPAKAGIQLAIPNQRS
jgi:hypothetical protein